jgi:aerobic carbon-monoxide dehydrogenase medium subunit
VKAPRFAYARPSSVADALALLAEHQGDARVLAGGQSLVPMLNFRVAAPKVLVDINRIAALSGIAVTKDCVRIGAMTRHAELERSPEIARHLPLLAQALPHVAHAAVRNRGTLGGSCALADPAAELPACALALGATFVVAGPAGERRVPAADFFTGMYATALDPGELLVAAEFPLPAPGYRSAFGELARRHGDYAIVGVAAHALLRDAALHDPRIVFFGVGDKPVRAAKLERALAGRPLGAVDAALRELDADLAPRADLHASAQTKLHLAKVLARRVLAQLEGAAP